MNIEKMREEFDLWFINNAPQCASLALSGDKVRIAMRELAWFSWKSSRQSLVIELPCSFRQDYMSSNQVIDEDRVIEAIEAAGVKVKS